MAGFKDLYEETNCIYPMECIQVLLGYKGKMFPQDLDEIMEFCGEQAKHYSEDIASIREDAELRRKEIHRNIRISIFILIFATIVTTINVILIAAGVIKIFG